MASGVAAARRNPWVLESEPSDRGIRGGGDIGGCCIWLLGVTSGGLKAALGTSATFAMVAALVASGGFSAALETSAILTAVTALESVPLAP